MRVYELPVDGNKIPLPLINLQHNCIHTIASVDTITIDCHIATAIVFDKDIVITMDGIDFNLGANNLVGIQRLETLEVTTLYEDTGYIKV